MADFKPDRELEVKEFNETFKPSKPGVSPRAIYMGWPIWAKNLAKIIVGVIIIVALLLIGRSVHHHSQEHSKNTASTPSTSTKKTPLKPSPAKTGKSGTGSNSNGSKGSSQSAQIANTGPGDVAALFAVAAVAGTSAHYIISRRQA